MKHTLVFVFFLSIIFSYGQSSEQAYRNADLPIHDRVEDLLSRMTLEEKVSQLFNESPAIPRLDIPAYNWWNECLHGVARAGKATVFPQAIGLAATFDQSLMLNVGAAISDEARAKHHYFLRNGARGIYMGLTFWTPNINIFRDPRWGRGQETYGEDPFLTGRMAVNFIKGLQGDDPHHLKAIATAKHYAVHSGPEFTRHSDNVFINDRDLYETYLPAFKAAVKEAHVESVMCAYNRLRDKPCCGSDLLLSKLLRDEFGFTGYVVSDCGAITDFYSANSHHIVETPSRAIGLSLSAGTDLNCEEAKAFVSNIDSAVRVGIINESDVNTSLRRLLSARFRLGMFDPLERQRYANLRMSIVGSKAHVDLAQQAAEKSIVLLKNSGVLPLKKNQRIALIGPNANNIDVLIGNYNGEPINAITPLQGIANYSSSKLKYSAGCSIVPGVYTDYKPILSKHFFHRSNGKLLKGLTASYFGSASFDEKPSITRTDSAINYAWERSPVSQKMDEPFAVQWQGILIPPATGEYMFSGNVKASIDGKLVEGTTVSLKKNVEYKFEAKLIVSSFWWASNYQQSFARLAWKNVSVDFRQKAIDAAKQSDVIIFCGGISPALEGEEMKIETDGFAHGDRTHINLPKIQEDLLKELRTIGKPLVYVNFSGSAVALNWEDENADAIVQAFYPGEATGKALARILFGETNPSGRLPVTFYKSVEDLPDFKDYRMQGRTYRFFKGTPLYPFGFGLSYSTFRYTDLSAPDTIRSGQNMKVKVELENAAGPSGEEVVQVYVTAKNSMVPVPVRSLVAFKRVALQSGQRWMVEFELSPKDFSRIDENYQRVQEPGDYVISIGGCQPEPASIRKNFVQQKEIKISGGRFLIVE